MRELKDHKAYEVLNKAYSQCLLDYVILQSEEAYIGEASHKKAVLEAFEILSKRARAGNHFNYKLSISPEAMSAIPCPVSQFLALPYDPYYKTRPRECRSYEIPLLLPYLAAFLEPPYGVPYTIKDFIKLNHVLFPFPDSLEVYAWNNEFSNYFDDGKEWWGTGCWSAYDPITSLFTVIGASLSD